MHLRAALPDYKIRPEKNISYFSLDKSLFEKKEIDLCVIGNGTRSAIEMKYPTNGQYPEQMFKFAQDIRFLEQLKAKGFADNLFLTFAKDSNFWVSSHGEGPIYHPFRGGETLSGKIVKPTGKKDKEFTLEGSYPINWKEIYPGFMYFTVTV